VIPVHKVKLFSLSLSLSSLSLSLFFSLSLSSYSLLFTRYSPPYTAQRTKHTRKTFNFKGLIVGVVKWEFPEEVIDPGGHRASLQHDVGGGELGAIRAV